MFSHLRALCLLAGLLTVTTAVQAGDSVQSSVTAKDLYRDMTGTSEQVWTCQPEPLKKILAVAASVGGLASSFSGSYPISLGGAAASGLGGGYWSGQDDTTLQGQSIVFGLSVAAGGVAGAKHLPDVPLARKAAIHSRIFLRKHLGLRNARGMRRAGGGVIGAASAGALYGVGYGVARWDAATPDAPILLLGSGDATFDAE